MGVVTPYNASFGCTSKKVEGLVNKYGLQWYDMGFYEVPQLWNLSVLSLSTVNIGELFSQFHGYGV